MIRRWAGAGLKLALGTLVALSMSAAIPVSRMVTSGDAASRAPEAGADASGCVRDSARRGVPGITVMAFASDDWGTRDVVAMAVTDAAGFYRMSALPGGVYGFWIQPNDVAGWIPTVAGDNVVACGAQIDHVDFEYDPVSSANVTGIAENESGCLGGADISLDGGRTTRTLADGSFCFTGVASGRHTLAATAKGCAVDRADFAVAAGDVAVVGMSPSPEPPSREEVARH